MSALTIAGREYRSLFLSPLAWVLLACIQAYLGSKFIVLLWGFEKMAPGLVGLAGAPGLTAIVVAPVIKLAAFVLLLSTPLVTMGAFAEERRRGTLALLLSAPVTMTEVVLGKFAGAMAFFLTMLAAVATLPLSLLLGASLDLGLLASTFLGLVLASMAFCALGLYLSSLTESPPAAAAATLFALLIFWVADWTGAGASTQGLATALNYLSITAHLDGLMRGEFDTGDVAYYLIFCGLFLALAVRRLDRLRLLD